MNDLNRYLRPIVASIAFISGVILYLRYAEFGRTTAGLIFLSQNWALAIVLLVAPGKKDWSDVPMWKKVVTILGIIIYFALIAVNWRLIDRI